MFEASLGDFFQVILIILLIYFGIKIIFRFFGPSIMRFIFLKIGQKFEKKFNQQQEFTNEMHRKGKTTIDKKPPSSRKVKKEVGEFIDYEEID